MSFDQGTQGLFILRTVAEAKQVKDWRRASIRHARTGRCMLEDTDMKEPELRTIDPLHHFSALEQVRQAYFEAHPMGDDDQAERDYLRYKLVCWELLMAHESFFDEASGFDWEGFSSSSPEYKLSSDLFLRWELAKVAMEKGI